MAHQRMFDPDDVLLTRVRRIALAMPGGQENVSHGRPAFFTRRIFVMYGASIKVLPRHRVQAIGRRT